MTETTLAREDTLLSIRSLSIAFRDTRVVHDVSFDVRKGQTLAIVGESGSGKSVTSLATTRLIDYAGGRITRGEILFRGRDGTIVDFATLPSERMRHIRGRDVAMIFQEPMTSLNPVFPVGAQIGEALKIHERLTDRQANVRALELLRMVRLPDAEALVKRYPHQLSGGMRQRVMIAIALACSPRLIIADEPTTALDVTIQAQILAILQDLKREMETAVIFITHDMGVVAQVADDVVVMWKGRKVEEGDVRSIFAAPRHAYTRALLSAVPRLGSRKGEPLPERVPVIVMEGEEAREIGVRRVQDTADYSKPLIAVKDLVTRFAVGRTLFGRVTHRVHAVEGVSFAIYPGETLALVGESGSGKSTIGRTLQQLIKPDSGTITYREIDIATMPDAQRRALREKIQYVFQDPFASLDPRRTVGYSIAEPIVVHNLLSRSEAVERRVHELLDRVGLSPDMASRYPHEFSGGQRQRVSIARALASSPDLVIADESVSALDVSIQAQVINLLMDIQYERGVAYLFITHDMSVVEKVAHRVAVMYLGQIVEIGPRDEVFGNPRHPYTQSLLAAVPVADPTRRRAGTMLSGDIPSPVRKVGDEPVRHEMIAAGPGHWVARETDATLAARGG
ncbi:dipeptide ABC transporter ATP-binding protein [Acuticoccus sp. I52.16.1]|uniref:ABC transporter ATP-binding protein n=1 Tax=Acuticoccus sp. I52.16.1 TaxID=2928472 RepID=UPI001FD2BADE|nr:dipeptide ABC transporter ATP-binding protein [Acuticoccus sp. I52.16.1]UOM35687.1 dipeptide ABC transporter ATP-binding protein [Acuticoccus sp. I52.16.1]